jgi:TrmH family RNA methyltransferase
VSDFISDKNPLIKEVRKAAHQGSLTQSGFALAEGPHLLDEALRSNRDVLAVILAETSRLESIPASVRLLRVSDQTFSTLATTETPQGVLSLVRPRTSTLADIAKAPSLIVILDGIQDPGNAGAILRAAEAFGATGAVFLKGSVNPYNPKCLRGSAGSIFRLPVVTGLTPADLPPNLTLYSTEPRAKKSLDQADFTQPCAIVIGAEGRGVAPELAARAHGVRIPTEHVESLNAAVAAGIVLYEARRQRLQTKAGTA